MVREIHYTFVLRLPEENEEFEGAFEDGLSYVLETVDQIEGADEVEFSVDLFQKVL